MTITEQGAERLERTRIRELARRDIETAMGKVAHKWSNGGHWLKAADELTLDDVKDAADCLQNALRRLS